MVSSVFGSLGNYYLSIFGMPKAVAKKLETLRANFFWGGNLGDWKINWCKWDSVLACRKKGGAGIGSLYAMNLALLYKWRWCGINNVDSLWARVIVDIHGNDCFLNMSANTSGLWKNITSACRTVHTGFELPSEVISRKVGNGKKTRFWKDTWCGVQDFASRFPRLFALENNQESYVFDKMLDDNWVWNWRRALRSGRESDQLDSLIKLLPFLPAKDAPDGWSWNLENKAHFAVAQVRKFIDNKYLVFTTKNNYWNNWVPRKINLFVWRLVRNGIPTNVNLFGRGVDVEFVSCRVCKNGIDDVTHLFSSCKLIKESRELINKWTNFILPESEPENVLLWIEDLNITSMHKKILHAIITVWWWHIWKERNNRVHQDSFEDVSNIFTSIVATSFLWISNRDRRHSYKWDEWIEYPFGKG